MLRDAKAKLPPEHRGAADAAAQKSAMEETFMERRSSRRLPLGLALKYGVLSPNAVLRGGVGKTRNVSGTGILFEADAELPVGTAVELSIEWPVRSEGAQGMELVVLGKVNRVSRTEMALSIMHYEFLPFCPLESLDTAAGIRPQLRKLLRRQRALQSAIRS